MNEIKESVTKLGVNTEIFSNKLINVEGCDCVLDYKNECIILKAGRMKMLIKGKSLKIKSLRENSVSISGIIHSVNFVY